MKLPNISRSLEKVFSRDKKQLFVYILSKRLEKKVLFLFADKVACRYCLEKSEEEGGTKVTPCCIIVGWVVEDGGKEMMCFGLLCYSSQLYSFEASFLGEQPNNTVGQIFFKIFLVYVGNVIVILYSVQKIKTIFHSI